MAGGSSSSKASNATRLRKRVEAESSASPSLKRAKDGSAFAKCEECSKDVPVALISFHNCSLDAKIKMNLETQVVEIPSEAKKKPTAEKKKAKSTVLKEKKENKAKNQNGRKRPTTAFFLFMKDFRKTFKEANPDCKSVATVAKEGGDKWKSMTDEEKKVYIDMAAELKAEYEKNPECNDAKEVDDEQVEEEEEIEKKVDDEQEIEEEEIKEVEEVKEKRRRLRKKVIVEEEEVKDKNEVIEEEDEEIKEETEEIKEKVGNDE